MLAPGRGPFGAACAAFAAVVVGVLVFGVSRAGADPPTFTPDPLPDITLEATGPSTPVTYSFTVDDDAGTQTPTLSCSTPSGASFAVGTWPVTCDATDPADNSVTTRSFNVIITDTTAPVVDPVTPPAPVEATGFSGATAAFTIPGATDLVD